MRKFLEEADTHGVKFVVDPASGRTRKAAWAILIAGSFAFLGYFFYLKVSLYLNHEVTTKVTFSKGRLVHLPPPKVCVDEDAIIDVKKLTASDIINARSPKHGKIYQLDQSSILQSINNSRYLRKEALGSFQEIILNGSDILGLCLRETFCSMKSFLFGRMVDKGFRPNWNIQLSALVKHGHETPLQDASEYNVNEVIERAHYDHTGKVDNIFFDTTLFECDARQQASNGTRFTSSCHDGYRTVFVRNGMCIVNTDFKGGAFQYDLSISRGKDSMYEGGVDYSYRVVVESPTEGNMDVMSRVTNPPVESGHRQHIRLNRKTETRKLGGLFNECQEKNDYTLSNCVEECMEEQWRHMFGCRLLFMNGRNTSLPVCTGKFLDDNKDAVGESGYFENAMIDCNKLCKIACQTNTYMTDEVGNLVHKEFNIVHVVSKIRVFSSVTTESVDVQELELYPLSSLLAELGGTMGLFIGISLLSIFHLLEFILLSLWKLLFRKFGASSAVKIDVWAAKL